MTHVDWHRVPKEEQSVLVTYIDEEGKIKVTEDTYFHGQFDYCQGELGCKVLAWSEMPDPYRPEVKDETHE